MVNQEVFEEEGCAARRPRGGGGRGGGWPVIGQASGAGVQAALLEVLPVVRQGRTQGAQLPPQTIGQQRWVVGTRNLSKPFLGHELFDINTP